jgi:TPR repeat protein
MITGYVPTVSAVKPKTIYLLGSFFTRASTRVVAVIFFRLTARNRWIGILTLFFFMLFPLQGYAEEADLAEEAPQVRIMLDEAMMLELSESDPDKTRRASMLYCKASRLGSLEAQYRLGMLYFLGRGVPKNLNYASALFSQAAQQGHVKAQDMLETIKFRASKLPPCMV